MEQPIYKVIDKDTLEDALQSFFECIRLPVQLLDQNGILLTSYGGMNDYCRFIQRFLRPGETCALFHQRAVSHALRIGEAYTFTCHSDINHIVFPLVSDNELMGSVLVGPFLMESPDTSMLSAVAGRYHLNMQDALELYETATSIPVLEPRMVNHLNHLLFHLFSNISKHENEQMRTVRGRSRQQSKISDVIRNYKTDGSLVSGHYPFEKEQLLVRKVRSGNISEARDVLNDLLAYVLLTSGYSLISAKTRSMELCTILSRTVIEAGADEERIMSLSSDFLESLDSTHDLDALCFKLQELTEAFVAMLFPDEAKVENDIIQTAISFIHQNYKSEISLLDVAKHVYLNPAYFSSIFKKATGTNYKEFLTNIRIEEAKKMLVTTNIPIVDVAMGCGFTSQSYFSKVFKAKTGFSPKSFRS